MKRFALAFSVAVASGGLAVGGMPSRAAVVMEPDLPTVAEVYAKVAKAAGGREALDKVKTMHFVINVTAQGQDIEMDCSWSRKGGRLTTAKMPMGEMSLGTDGTTAWMKNPMGGYMLAPEQVKQQLRIAAMPMMMLDPTTMPKKDADGVKVVGKETFHGKECIKLNVPKSDAATSTDVFIEAETGIPVGAVETKDKTSMVLGDWKTVEGVKFFHSVAFEGKGQNGPETGEMKITTLQVNTVEESAFVLPEEVKKLVDGKKADAAAPEIKISDLDKTEQKEAEEFVKSLKSMDLETLKRMDKQVGMGAEYMPENKKKTIKFYQQEIKKEIATRK